MQTVVSPVASIYGGSGSYIIQVSKTFPLTHDGERAEFPLVAVLLSVPF